MNTDPPAKGVALAPPPVVAAIDRFVKTTGHAPSIAEIREMVDFRQRFPIHRTLEALEWLGGQFLKRELAKKAPS